ncbi:MAG: hypothetical protein EOO73_19530 [Myxococcales bacterium]|nr:MAG: hypothetical protein EOO73_19530 [Myxococcales bacterium]
MPPRDARPPLVERRTAPAKSVARSRAKSPPSSTVRAKRMASLPRIASASTIARALRGKPGVAPGASSLPCRERARTRRFQITTARLHQGPCVPPKPSITVEALSLPSDERAALVLRLAESLDEEHDADADDAWAAEVAARIEAVRAGTAETIDDCGGSSSSSRLIAGSSWLRSYSALRLK